MDNNRQPPPSCSEVFFFLLGTSSRWHVSSIADELESLVQESEEAAGAGYAAMVGGEAAPPSRPAQVQQNAKRAKCVFVGDVDMPQAVSESYKQ